MARKLVCLAIQLLIHFTSSYKILAIFPYFGRSHYDVLEPITIALANKGHEVTVISYFGANNKTQNYRDIILDKDEDFEGDTMVQFGDFADDTLYGKYHALYRLHDWALKSCKSGIQSKGIRKLLEKTNESFDVIIIEAFLVDCYLGFAHHFKAPFVQITSSNMLPRFSQRFGQPTHPAYIPACTVDASDRMRFLDKVRNLLILFGHEIIYRYDLDIQENDLARIVFGDKLPPLHEIAMNASLLLMNTYFALTRPKALVPAVIEIGGVHVGANKPLPKGTKNWPLPKKEKIANTYLVTAGDVYPEKACLSV